MTEKMENRISQETDPSYTNCFFDTRGEPFADRESFNNAILLLTTVKRGCYYITGFDRRKLIVEVGFDLDTLFGRRITEKATVDFRSSPEFVVIRGRMDNISSVPGAAKYVSKREEACFRTEGDSVFFEKKIANALLETKKQISRLLKECCENAVNNKKGTD